MMSMSRLKYTERETIALLEAIKVWVRVSRDGRSAYVPFAEILEHSASSFQEGRSALSLGYKWKGLKQKFKDKFGTVVTKPEIHRFCDKLIRIIECQMVDKTAKFVASKVGSSSNQDRKKWNENEVAALKKGYTKHKDKYNKWASILEEFGSQFNDRTVVNLKDKWRNLREEIKIDQSPKPRRTSGKR